MKRIILVDDEKMVVESISNLVHWEKCSAELIATCLNAYDALDIIAADKPDIVITDIKMPVLDGLELIRRAREIKPDIEFIVLSGYEEFELAKRAMKEGVKFYLLKPCSEDEIMEAVSASIKEIESREVNKINLLNSEEIQTELVRQMILMSIQGEARMFLKDDSFWHVIEKKHLVWVGISEIASNLRSESLCELFREIEGEKQKFIPLIVNINHYINVFFLCDNPELSLEQINCLKASLAHREILQAIIFINHSILISELETGIVQEEGNYEDFNYTIGGEWNYKQKSQRYLKKDVRKEMERLEKSFYEESLAQMEAVAQDIINHNSNDTVISVLSNFFLRHLLLGDVNYEAITTLLDGFFHGYNAEKTVSATTELLGKMISKKGNKDAIDTIVTYVEEHLADEALTLKRISKEVVFLSEDYVGKKFQQRTGRKFTVYLNEKRIERAKILLRTDKNERNESIAVMVGYGNNPEYFCKIFKKYTGYTPKEYRNIEFKIT